MNSKLNCNIEATNNMHENDISYAVRGAAFKIHSALARIIHERLFFKDLKYY